MEIIELLDKVDESFNTLKSNNKFVVRDRVYLGTSDYGESLVSSHDQVIYCKSVCSTISGKYYDIEKQKMNGICNNIIESIDILRDYSSTLEKTDIIRYKQIVKLNVLELIVLIEKGTNFKEDEYIEPVTLSDEEVLIKRNQAIIEDNLDQITLSSLWKNQERNESNQLTILKDTIETCKQLSKKITQGINLQLLSQIAQKIRDASAQDLETLKDHLGCYMTISAIINEGENNGEMFTELNAGGITLEAIRLDIERRLNTRRYNWLVHLFIECDETNQGERVLFCFATKLFELSRNKLDEFSWNVKLFSRISSDGELKRLIIHYSFLSSTLISVIHDLEEMGEHELVEEILNHQDIVAQDAISDLEEIYKPENVNSSHLTKALKIHIEKLKELLLV
ncbi:MAG: hypothetical protein OEY49_03030, partial [Candidatus Heimdallarchaeota archaeon]|nr:hypothetical protein [Candidatus Heimdallarchaeota archaeon]